MAPPGSFPWRKPDVKNRRQAGVAMDSRDFSGEGRYLRKNGGPGRGPYPWRTSGIEWDAQLPQGSGATSLHGTEAEGWWRAPPTSHLDAFRLVWGLDDDDPLELQILFKAESNPGHGHWAYGYWAKSLARKQRLETIYEMMTVADHPGELVWSCLILEKFDYGPIDPK